MLSYIARCPAYPSTSHTLKTLLTSIPAYLDYFTSGRMRSEEPEVYARSLPAPKIPIPKGCWRTHLRRGVEEVGGVRQFARLLHHRRQPPRVAVACEQGMPEYLHMLAMHQQLMLSRWRIAGSHGQLHAGPQLASALTIPTLPGVILGRPAKPNILSSLFNSGCGQTPPGRGVWQGAESALLQMQHVRAVIPCYDCQDNSTSMCLLCRTGSNSVCCKRTPTAFAAKGSNNTPCC